MQAVKQTQNMTAEQALERVQQMSDNGNLAQAETLCRRIVQAQPNFHPAYFQLGMIAVKVGKMQVAAEMITKAIRIEPGIANYHRAVGEIYRRLNQYDKAIEHGSMSTRLNRENPEGYYNLGIALSDAGQYENAVEAYRSALSKNPNYGLAANNLGACLETLGDEQGAVEAYSKAIEINPAHAEAQNNLGAILSARGDLDEAKACFNAAIEGDPDFIYAHYNLCSLKKYKEDDPHLAMLEERLKGVPQMSREARIRFWFAIGKAWEDTGKYHESFDAYKRGNTLKRTTFTYNVANTEAHIDDTIQKFDKAFGKKKCKGYEDETPVFIVGMPRSGTTLIEQILSSHSKVHGAGELRDLCAVVDDVKGLKAEVPYMDWLLKADDKDIAGIGKAYVERLRTHDNDAERISDKMPGNFFYVGLIHKAMPNAKIVHSMRDPVDTCISNYSRLFNETMPFAYDLEELGRYCRMCDTMMAHWKSVLPKGTILDMQYEENVADLETQAKKLIEFCGLEWEEGCLDFHKNKRHVKTASIAQVRQPIYKSSVARWKRYEKDIGPLLKAIEGK